MKKGKSFDENIMVRTLCGEASRDEVNALQAWVDEKEEHKLTFLELQDSWITSQVTKALGQDELAHDWSRIEKRMNEKQDEVLISAQESNYPRSMWWKAAAIFLVGFALSWFIFRGTSVPSTETSDFHVVSTPLGSQSTIQLPDGSRVVLNAGSRLKYPQNFKGGNRQVHLEGEAFFEVEKQRRRKFIVYTDDIAIKVYGTTFNVKAYPDEKTVETTLIEGKISIVRANDTKKKNKKELDLSPNQRLVIYKGSGRVKNEVKVAPEVKKEIDVPVTKDRLILSRNIEPEIFTSWKDGHLIIETEPMEKLAVKLERKYNVQFHYEDDSIRSVRFSGKIEDETIEQVMAAMALASPLQYRIEDRDIWIGIAEKGEETEL